MKIKKIILILLLLLNCSIIFIFSHQNGTKSSSVSNDVAFKMIDSYSLLTKQKLNKSERELIGNYIKPLVRKSAHFTIYLSLGILTYLLIKEYNLRHPVVKALIFCVLYATGDELHQLFILNRSASIIDVLLDTSGSIFGIIVANTIKK